MLEVPPCNLGPSMVYSVPRDLIVQRACCFRAIRYQIYPGLDQLATLIYKRNFQINDPCPLLRDVRAAHIIHYYSVPFSNSYQMNNSIAYRRAVIWNLLSPLANCRGIKAKKLFSLLFRSQMQKLKLVMKS